MRMRSNGDPIDASFLEEGVGSLLSVPDLSLSSPAKGSEDIPRAPSSPILGGRANGLSSESGLDMLLVDTHSPDFGSAVPLPVSRGVAGGASCER